MNYDEQNIFAKIIRRESPAEIIFENEATLAIMDVMPRVDGHALVIPKAASINLLDITLDDLTFLMSSVQLIAKAALDAFQADGITLQQFNNAAGGQMVFHTHFHILPRHDGIDLKAHSGAMEDGSILKANAEKYRKILGT